jgi:hypothetical protein
MDQGYSPYKSRVFIPSCRIFGTRIYTLKYRIYTLKYLDEKPGILLIPVRCQTSSAIYTSQGAIAFADRKRISRLRTSQKALPVEYQSSICPVDVPKGA